MTTDKYAFRADLVLLNNAIKQCVEPEYRNFAYNTSVISLVLAQELSARESLRLNPHFGSIVWDCPWVQVSPTF